MSINIQKGANLALLQAGVHRQQCFIGLGWTPPAKGISCEIDASAFVLDENGKVCSDGSFIFYNHPCDNLGGFVNLLEPAALVPGSDETAGNIPDRQNFMVDLAKAPAGVSRIVFCLTIHEAEPRRQSFALTEQVRLRLVDGDSGREALRFTAENEYSTETAVSMGELYRRNDEWKFRAVGQGYAGGLAALARGFGVDIEDSLPPEDVITAPDPELEKRGNPPASEIPAGLLVKKKRRSTEDIMAGQAAEIRSRIRPLLPQILSAMQAGANESSSRLILDKILQQVLGYSIEEIKAEQRIQGRSADYVMSPGGVDMMVIEAKRIGGPLKDKQIFQATSYAAYAGIKWALLTNVMVWRLYKISTLDKIEPHLMFTVDLSRGVSEEAAGFLTLISRAGIVRKTALERLWLLRRALSTESLVSAILHEEVLARIRRVLTQENGIQLDPAEIKNAVERNILRLE